MKTKLQSVLVFCLCLGFTFSYAQTIKNAPQKVKSVSTLNYRFVPSIAQQLKDGTFIPGKEHGPGDRININPKLRHGAQVIPGKGSTGPDPLMQKQLDAEKFPTKAPSLVFNSANSSQIPAAVSDPTGAVGRDFYIAAWNVSWRIFNKDGSPATPAASLGTLFGGRAPGDPICLYDSAADRYIVIQFDGPQVQGSINGFHIAVSQTNDPVNDGWHVYSPSDFTTAAFPDYEKMSIWSDGYYMSANIGTDQVFALDRDKMLAGDPTATMQTFGIPGLASPIGGFFSPQFLTVTDDNLPAAGGATLVYQQDDAYSGVAAGNDHFKLWTLDVDFDTPANSQISAPIEFPVSSFNGVFDGGSFSNLSQPAGPDIDALQALIANQAQFRKFPTYNSALFNHVVDVGTGGAEIAAVRWYELRQTADNQPWTIHQEGTYVAPEGRHAWNASMAMDANGNIGMGYTSMGGTNNESISSRYTGQFAGAPSGVMNAIEEVILQGSGNSTSFRYADYSHITVDPSDDATFWFVNEVYNPAIINVVGVFQLTEPSSNDVGVISIDSPENGVLGAAEEITVSIRNFGLEDQSNFPVSYTIDGGTPVTATFSGTVLAGETVSYTFTETADFSVTNQTYSVEACTGLGTDADASNDCTTQDITNALDFCVPTANLGCNVDGIKRFVLEDIDSDDGGSGCNGNGQGYADNTNLSTNLDRADGVNQYVLQAQQNWAGGVGVELFSVWIDFNDDGTFQDSERLISGEVFTAAGSLTDFDLLIPTDAALGTHILRAKAIDGSAAGDILDPCSDFDFGEVHDFTVTIVDSSLGTNDFTLDGSELTILSKDNKQYEISFNSLYNDKLTFNLYDALGRQIVFSVLEKVGDSYKYDLDMSYASSGVYIVKVGRGGSFKVGRIIVK